MQVVSSVDQLKVDCIGESEQGEFSDRLYEPQDHQLPGKYSLIWEVQEPKYLRQAHQKICVNQLYLKTEQAAGH